MHGAIVFQYPIATSNRKIIVKFYDPTEKLVRTFGPFQTTVVFDIAKPTAGKWTYTVEAVDFPQSDQNFSQSYAIAISVRWVYRLVFQKRIDIYFAAQHIVQGGII